MRKVILDVFIGEKKIRRYDESYLTPCVETDTREKAIAAALEKWQAHFKRVFGEQKFARTTWHVVH
jgi:hypothetical protein